MNFRKTMSLLVMLSLSLFLLSGCAVGRTKLELSLEPNTGEIKLSPRTIKTDGDSISVKAKGIPSGAEIQVYLYNEASPNEYILVENLSSTKNFADFPITNTDYSYKIGAVLFGTDETVTLVIKYNKK